MVFHKVDVNHVYCYCPYLMIGFLANINHDSSKNWENRSNSLSFSFSLQWSAE